MMSLAVRVPFDDPLFHPKKMYVNGNFYPPSSCFTALYIPTYEKRHLPSKGKVQSKRSISADAIFFLETH